MKKIVNSKLVSVPAGTSMATAKELMTTKRIRYLPVVNEKNEIINVLSAEEMKHADRFQDSSVEHYALKPVQYVKDETPLSTVALLMIEKNISSVILCNSKYEAIGIITTEALLLQFSQIMKKIEKRGLKEVNEMDFVIGAGEFFRRLSEIGI